MRERQRAEACFAVARSATFEGERAAAISRGRVIVAKAGLDLATFNFPGNVATRAVPRYAPNDLFVEVFGDQYSAFATAFRRWELEAMLKEFVDAHIRAEAERARQHEDVADEFRARRRARSRAANGI